MSLAAKVTSGRTLTVAESYVFLATVGVNPEAITRIAFGVEFEDVRLADCLACADTVEASRIGMSITTACAGPSNVVTTAILATLGSIASSVEKFESDPVADLDPNLADGINRAVLAKLRYDRTPDPRDAIVMIARNDELMDTPKTILAAVTSARTQLCLREVPLLVDLTLAIGEESFEAPTKLSAAFDSLLGEDGPVPLGEFDTLMMPDATEVATAAKALLTVL